MSRVYKLSPSHRCRFIPISVEGYDWRTLSRQRDLVVAIAVVVVSIVLMLSRAASAAPAQLDDTYGRNGWVAFGFSGYDQVAVVATVLDAEGRQLLLGRCEQRKPAYFCVARLLQDGALDLTFGQGGRRVISEIGEGNPFAVVIRPDGKILAGGNCRLPTGVTACVVRLRVDGSLDSSYGNGGIATIAIAGVSGAAATVQSMQLAHDGRLGLGISCSADNLGFRFCAAKLDSDGALDPAFGEGGTILIEPTSGQHKLVSMALDANGRWLLAGTCFTPTQAFCIARLLANGVKDLTFGYSGELIYRFASGTTHAMQHLILETDQRIVLAGRCRLQNDQRDRACALGLTEDGEINRAFGEVGALIYFTSGTDADMTASAIQSDGRRVVASTCHFPQAPTAPDFCFYRLNADGTLDGTLPLAGDMQQWRQFASTVAVDNQGRILIAGSCGGAGVTEPNQFCVARYEGGPYASTMCSFDLDGDGVLNPSIDGLILLRASLGFTGDALLRDIVFPPFARRTVWGGDAIDDLRRYLVAQCGMSLEPVVNAL